MSQFIPHTDDLGFGHLELPGLGHMLRVHSYVTPDDDFLYPFVIDVVQDRYSQESYDEHGDGTNARQIGHLTNAHAQALVDFLASRGFAPTGYVDISFR